MGNRADTPVDLNSALSALGKDWTFLSARLQTIQHSLTTPCSRLTLRLHYPSLRDAKATIHELVEAATLFLPHFCLPRAEVEEVYAKKGTMSDLRYHAALSTLDRRARDLFMRAQATTGRSGEAGELLLYLLTEWLLEAPQIVAKMSLKTNPSMPVHGSDGIHVKFLPGTAQLVVYSGEAKLYADVGDAVRSAIKSITEALSPEKMKHELQLVRRDVDFSGLEPLAREEMLRFLDPLEPKSTSRIEAVTCLIGFDFAGYTKLVPTTGAETTFHTLALKQLERTGESFAGALTKAGLAHQTVELFLMPLPSVEELRAVFHARIGHTAS